MSFIFNILVFQPIYNVLVLFYNLIPGKDFGIAIIATTLLLKFFFLPLSRKQIESQNKMREFQPQIKAIQEKYKGDKEKQTRELMDFYKKNKVNPLGGCLPIVIQLVFLIAIYRVLFAISQAGLAVDAERLYSFVTNPGGVNHFFLGIVDLAKPNLIFAFLAAAGQFIQTKMMIGKTTLSFSTNNKSDFTEIMNKQMLFLGPILTFSIGIKFAAGVSLYWIVSTVFAIAQQWYLQKGASLEKKK